MLADGFFNARRKYRLHGEVWQRDRNRGPRTLTLERYDGSSDAGFFLYFDDVRHGFIGRIHAANLSKSTKYVEFKKDTYRVKVLRDDLLAALEALS